MSVSAFLSTLRGAGRQHLTASTITATATCSHLLRINEYTSISKKMANGQSIRSGTFRVGGHDWRLLCYPNGCLKAHEGSVSLFLEHASHEDTGDTTAKFEMSILPDVNSKPIRSRSLAEYNFTENGLNWGWRDFIKHADLDKEKHLRDDCLTVLCDVTVTDPHTADHHVEVEAAAPPESTLVAGPAPPFDLRGQLEEAIWNKQQVDVKIEVGGETFPAHRWMLEARSPVLKADLLLASTTGDGATLLRVNDMDAQVFKAMLQFIYTDSPPALESATVAERMLVAADRYELEELKLICEEVLSRHVDMGSVADTLALAERHHCSLLRTACIKFLTSPGNFEAFVATDGFAQLKRDCPSAVSDLVANKLP
ncbi:BTB/POZ and MATH domain-containing protein 2-like [Lolium perenne]|uniref:BTB/POZ and MATH domain-containing protein 2-like n=1 Tax=Lolium perenne TaxID=4522 RepID=UPI0021E9E545|nr:BTB/POZ and MATH domain-containing protein 2-like [Lolium perenne]